MKLVKIPDEKYYEYRLNAIKVILTKQDWNLLDNGNLMDAFIKGLEHARSVLKK